MLSDFLLLELYYDAPETALAYEDLVRQYDVAQLQQAVKQGYIKCSTVFCRARAGRALFWLTEAGRKQASIA